MRAALFRTFVVLMATAMSAKADGLLALCAATKATPDVCDCASEAVAFEVAQDDYALYHRLGTDMARIGRPTQHAAWEEAIGAESARSGVSAATIRNRAGAVRRTHLAHIAHCGG